MSRQESADEVRRTLSMPTVHAAWEGSYYSRDTERFYERALAEVVAQLGAPRGATIFDAGCGQGYHAVRLARLGYRVHAVDFSEHVLAVAKENIAKAGFAEAIELRREDLTALTSGDESVRYILCWGVLMHVPEIARAVAELSRVLEPGGVIAVSEGNDRSLDALAIRLLRLARRGASHSSATSTGLETWKETPAGPLLTRQVNVRWLVREFERNGLRLEHRRAGEFTEAYTKIRAPLVTSGIHALNRLWFERVRNDLVASGTLLFLRKPA
jgi:2-polyprenyl-3-methyl-5-hydroxy-6-metoxy-1,4-benzoquinol methylase